LLTFLLMSSWGFNEEEEPCFETNDWARMGIPAEDRLVFQGAGFDERSGFEIRLVPNQCSRMMILVAFGSSSRTVHPDDHWWSMQVSKVSQPWIFLDIPANLYYPTSNPRFHRVPQKPGKKFVSQRGKQARPNHVRHRCMDGILTCVPTVLESSLFQKRSTLLCFWSPACPSLAGLICPTCQHRPPLI
jgi:hypothetical protein